MNIELTDQTGTDIEIGQIINYYAHFSDRSVPKVCVILFDYLGNTSAFFDKDNRHVLEAKHSRNIRVIGTVKDDPELVPEELLWTKQLFTGQ